MLAQLPCHGSLHSDAGQKNPQNYLFSSKYPDHIQTHHNIVAVEWGVSSVGRDCRRLGAAGRTDRDLPPSRQGGPGPESPAADTGPPPEKRRRASPPADRHLKREPSPEPELLPPEPEPEPETNREPESVDGLTERLQDGLADPPSTDLSHLPTDLSAGRSFSHRPRHRPISLLNTSAQVVTISMVALRRIKM